MGRLEEERYQAALRLGYLTQLFLTLGLENDRDRMQAWIEATMELGADHLLIACRKLGREWKNGTPRPAHLIAAARERRPEDASRQPDTGGGPWVRLDDMARAMGLAHLSDLADPEMTREEREIACERYESAMQAGTVPIHLALPLVGA